MIYLQKMGVAHCDLKPPNVLYSMQSPSNTNPSKCEIKLCDFGLAHISKCKSRTGCDGVDQQVEFFTPFYAAPEVINGEIPPVYAHDPAVLIVTKPSIRVNMEKGREGYLPPKI